MNITWALLMMALGGVGVPNQGHEADVAAALQSAMNPPIVAEHTTNPDAAASPNGGGTASPAPSPSASPETALLADPQPDAPKVKGIYVTAYSAGGARMETLLALLDKTEPQLHGYRY